ncbi:MAG: protease SohB [Gammaproteobacteria bacterium]|nr:protease SohB [Gammaproteobacteria bacterium]
MDYLYDYLVFLAQAVTVVVAVLVIVSGIAAAGMRMQSTERGHLEVTKLNDRLNSLKRSIQEALLDASSFKKERKQEAKAAKRDAKASKAEKADPGGKRRVFVLDFHGDLQATRVKDLSTEVTALLTLARAEDEVVVRVESPGGLVHGYGLAASQLDRIKQHGIPLVVAVDKVAASGGYLMAAVADKVVAAPFAVMGSIGVVAQIPNVHRLLKKHDVDVEVLTAGKYKRTLTVLGENTEEGRQKFVEELEDVHALFQEFVSDHRPQVDIEAVATGETWYGQRAIDLKLIDEISTSDEYLSKACESADVYSVHWVEHKKPLDRIMARVESSAQRLIERVLNWGGAP